MPFNSNNRTLRRRERINDSPTKIYWLDAITVIAKLLTLRYFCGECCGLDQQIICLFNNRTDNYWFCPNCAKPALNAVFVEKDKEERCVIFVESISKKVRK